MDKKLIQKQLITIAQAEEDNRVTVARLRKLQGQLAATIDALMEPPAAMRHGLKEDIKAAVERGEEIDHVLVTVKCRKKWRYDRDDALDFAINLGLEGTVKRTLKIREFEKNLLDHRDDFHRFDFEAEQVEVVDIALPKDLSYLLINDPK